MSKIAIKSVVLSLVASIAVNVFSADKVSAKEDWRAEAREKFDAQRFGIFLHWGIYASYAQGEWYLQRKHMREADYARMMYGFYPSNFDARRWARSFKNAGAKYVTITSRHHDGFSMWPSKAGAGYTIADTPFKRDVLGELAEACKAEGLQFNLYYSLMDWHHPNYPVGREWRARKTLKNVNENYQLYKKFMMDQLTELLDAYRPGVIWFDGEWDHDPKYSHIAFPIDWELEDLYSLIHSKGALVANNHHHDMRESEDIQIFEGYLPGEKDGNGDEPTEEVSITRPLEQCDVIQRGVWGYKVEGFGTEFKSAEEVVAMVARAAGMGVNLLMNIGPRADGSFPEEVDATLERVGKWFAVNGESIYGTVAGGVTTGEDIVSTRKGDALYLHFVNPRAKMVALPLEGKVVSATALWNGAAAKVAKADDGTVVVTAPPASEPGFDRVIKLVIAGAGRR